MFVKAKMFCFSEKNHDRSAIKPKHTSTLHCVVKRHCNLSLCQHLCLNAIRLTHDLIRNDRTPTTPNYHTPDLCWLTPVSTTAQHCRDPANICNPPLPGSRSEFDHFTETLQEQTETKATSAAAVFHIVKLIRTFYTFVYSCLLTNYFASS